LGEFFTGFRDFLNANNSVKSEASQLKLRLLCGSPQRYEPAKSKLSRFNSKKVDFRTFDPYSKPWGGDGPTGPRSVVGPRRGFIVTKHGDEKERLIFGGLTSNPAAARSENPTKRGRGTGL
jgi:hypothetical protein